ncbi:hypothetical protein [Deinococcus cavernae]|uniref:hypothetical protein n=1 Tax=Deinococcus cavernae TaxID=2320857 RepID=UPI0011C22D52|nr:hypothetical protein [Deinococcus cavernae]
MAPQEFYDVVEHTMVRRSRRDVRRRQERGESVIIAGQEIRFPERTLHRWSTASPISSVIFTRGWCGASSA